MGLGTAAEDTSAWMIDPDTFWKRWNGSRRIYLVTSADTYDMLRHLPGRSYFLIARDKNNVILSNKEDAP